MADRPSGATDFASGTSQVVAPTDTQIQSGLPATQTPVNLFNGIFRRLFRWMDFLSAREHPRYGGLNIVWSSARPRVKLPFTFGEDTAQEDKAEELEVYYITSASRRPVTANNRGSFEPAPGRPLIKELQMTAPVRAMTLSIQGFTDPTTGTTYQPKALSGFSGNEARIAVGSGERLYPTGTGFIQLGDPQSQGLTAVPAERKWQDTSLDFIQVLLELLGITPPEAQRDIDYRVAGFINRGGATLWDIKLDPLFYGVPAGTGRPPATLANPIPKIAFYSADRRNYIVFGPPVPTPATIIARRPTTLPGGVFPTNITAGGFASPPLEGQNILLNRYLTATHKVDYFQFGDLSKVNRLRIIEGATERTIQTARGTIYSPPAALALSGSPAFSLAKLEYVPENNANKLELTLGGTVTTASFDSVALMDGQGALIRSFQTSDASFSAADKKFTWSGDFPDPAGVRQIAFFKLGAAVTADVLQRIAASDYSLASLSGGDFLQFRDGYSLPANNLFIKKVAIRA